MEKAIAIKEENRETIKAAIDEAEKRARVRTIGVDAVYEAAGKMTKYLNIDVGLTLTEMVGTEVTVNPYAHEEFASSYNGAPEATKFKMIYKKGGWRIVEVYRGLCRTTPKRKYVIKLPEKLTPEQILKRVSVYG